MSVAEAIFQMTMVALGMLVLANISLVGAVIARAHKLDAWCLMFKLHVGTFTILAAWVLLKMTLDMPH